MTLFEAADAIRRRSMSSLDTVRDCIAQSKLRQAEVNAFITLDEASAVHAAEAADTRLLRGDPAGPLHGVPLAHKDMFDRAGHRCSFGSRIQQAVPPEKSAFVIQQLERAGAITIGALNMSEFALGPTGHNATFGHCRNPWDPQRISGGSSSGAGVAVAAGMIFGALGSDTGGSIRIPAACCGVVGLKPTQGRISRHGAMPLSPSLDCIGPIARTVDDCALLFKVLTDSSSAGKHREDRVQQLVYPSAALTREIAPDVLSALSRAAQVFEQLGIRLVDRPLPDISHLHQLADAIQKPESAACHYTNLRDHRAAYTRSVRRRIESGFLVSAPAYIHALEQRGAHLRAFVEDTLSAADGLLLPTLGFPTPAIEETDEEKVGAQPELVGRMTRWTRWLNYLGVPALSVPCGFDVHGMPVGMQIVGRPDEEDRLFAIARLFESNTYWRTATWPRRA